MTPILEEPSTGTGQEVACNDYRLLIIGCCGFLINRRITVSHRTSLLEQGLLILTGRRQALAAGSSEAGLQTVGKASPVSRTEHRRRTKLTGGWRNPTPAAHHVSSIDGTNTGGAMDLSTALTDFERII